MDFAKKSFAFKIYLILHDKNCYKKKKKYIVNKVLVLFTLNL